MNIQRLLKFILAGGTAAAVEYGVFLLLHYQNVRLLIANSASFSAGLFVSFTINRLWVFQSKSYIRKQFTAYCVLAIINLAVSNAFIAMLVDMLDVLPSIAKFLTMVIIAAWNYVLFSRLIFKGSDG